MRKLYTILLLVFCAVNVNAAKTIRLGVNLVSPANNARIFVNQSFNEKVVLTNLGPGNIVPGDTLLYIDPLTPSNTLYYFTGFTKNVNDTIQVNIPFPYLLTDDGIYDVQYPWFFEAFFRNGSSIVLDSIYTNPNNSNIVTYNAQKKIRLNVNIQEPANNSSLYSDDTFKQKCVVTNLGPDAISIGDTIAYIDPVTPQGYFLIRIMARNVAINDTFHLDHDTIYNDNFPIGLESYCVDAQVRNGDLINMDSSYQICNSVNILPDPVPQRTVNLLVTLVTPPDNFSVTAGSTFTQSISITNLGPDAINYGDTLIYTDPITLLSGIPRMQNNVSLNVNGTTVINDNITLPSVTPVGTAPYCVTAHVVDGAAIAPNSPVQDCNNVTVVSTSGVAQLNKAGGTINFYPNPADKEVSFNYASNSSAALSAHVFDMVGREVLVHNYGNISTSGQNRYNLDIANLNAGIYIVELRQDGVRSIGSINKKQ